MHVPDPLLTDAEIEAALGTLKGWVCEGKALACTVQLSSFRAALAYIQKVGDLAEAHGHHPDIHLSYKTVSLTLFTHSAGGLTRKDIDLARDIGRLEKE